ncbi:Asp/Glu racemase [Sphingomonas oleivorans]|uniref:Maleate isomerase n=1 Tax=Sphingomonas oleivorans TaxID=1735121 RepID=A0A2T5FU18_9SPHN|nr:Asp/Glu racemase [Sphingomonas oleivorans]
MHKSFKIGQIVPSSNTTMETEIPAMLRAREAIRLEKFTFHSSRMRMKKVTADELAAMDGESDRCAIELSDARVDLLGYACLVAIMAMGHGYHRTSQQRLRGRTQENGTDIPVITSAGALVDSLHHMGVRKVALVAPYMKPLTGLVVDYIRAEGIEVADHVALEIPDNLEVGRHDPARLPEIVARLDTSDVDAVVLSACVQMPSLPVVPRVEAMTGKPVVTAAIATTFQMLRALELEPVVPGAGALLSGAY